jgi:hypothetical protein
MSDNTNSSKKRDETSHSIQTPLTSVSSNLAAIFIRKNVEKGCKPEIPSLDIKLEKKNKE